MHTYSWPLHLSQPLRLKYSEAVITFMAFRAVASALLVALMF